MQFRVKLPEHLKESLNRTAILNGMKTRVKQIHDEHQLMKKTMKDLIRMSGFKMNHIYEQLNMSAMTFHRRMETGEWRDHEIEKLIEILHLD
jgi:hypothetical protein